MLDVEVSAVVAVVFADEYKPAYKTDYPAPAYKADYKPSYPAAYPKQNYDYVSFSFYL